MSCVCVHRPVCTSSMGSKTKVPVSIPACTPCPYVCMHVCIRLFRREGGRGRGAEREIKDKESKQDKERHLVHEREMEGLDAWFRQATAVCHKFLNVSAPQILKCSALVCVRSKTPMRRTFEKQRMRVPARRQIYITMEQIYITMEQRYWESDF